MLSTMAMFGPPLNADAQDFAVHILCGLIVVLICRALRFNWGETGLATVIAMVMTMRWGLYDFADLVKSILAVAVVILGGAIADRFNRRRKKKESNQELNSTKAITLIRILLWLFIAFWILQVGLIPLKLGSWPVAMSIGDRFIEMTRWQGVLFTVVSTVLPVGLLVVADRYIARQQKKEQSKPGLGHNAD